MQYRRTVIALDFDRTFTGDRVLWAGFISSAVARGHKVYIVTARSNKPENTRVIAQSFGSLYPLLVGVIYTNHQPKRAFMEQLNIHVDWWIDDIPETIGETSPEALAAVKASLPSDETIQFCDEHGKPVNLYPSKGAA
jgi:hypothetical protein